MPYFLMEASAKMPASCKGRYGRIAIVKAETRPPRIDERIAGVEIVETWEKLHIGRTTKCAYAKALEEAKEKLKSLEEENKT